MLVFFLDPSKNVNKCTNKFRSDKLMPNQGERIFAQLVILIKNPY